MSHTPIVTIHNKEAYTIFVVDVAAKEYSNCHLSVVLIESPPFFCHFSNQEKEFFQITNWNTCCLLVSHINAFPWPNTVIIIIIALIKFQTDFNIVHMAHLKIYDWKSRKQWSFGNGSTFRSLFSIFSIHISFRNIWFREEESAFCTEHKRRRL